MAKTTEYTNVWDMNSRLLLMEFERLTILESKGENDESVSYKARDLESQIMHRLNEYDVDRF